MNQHTSPCSMCPFSRKCPPGFTGGSHPMVYVGQTMGPFLLSCHSVPDYSQANPTLEIAQCAGAAIFRSNINRASLMPKQILTLPSDTNKVFASHRDFLSHHLEVSLERACQLLELHPPEYLLLKQMSRPSTRTLAHNAQ